MPFTSLEACTVRLYDDLIVHCSAIRGGGVVAENRMPDPGVNDVLRAKYLNFGNNVKYTLKAGRNVKRRLENIMDDNSWTYTKKNFTVQKSNTIIADAESGMRGTIIEEDYSLLTRLQIHKKLVEDYVDNQIRGYCRMNEFSAQIENRRWGLNSGTNAAERVYSVVIDIKSYIRYSMDCIDRAYLDLAGSNRLNKIIKIPRAQGKDFGFKQTLCTSCNEVTV